MKIFVVSFLFVLAVAQAKRYSDEDNFSQKPWPPKCPENEEYLRCGPGCPHICSVYQDPYIPCPKRCSSGCFCKAGYIRSRLGGICVRLDKCPKNCGPTEQYSQCMAHDGCEKSCYNYNLPFICPRICVSGCICADGYIRDGNGKCMRKKYCPNICPKNEVYTDCIGCEPTCAYPYSPKSCKKRCIPGCTCKPGYFRSNSGKCVRLRDCPPLYK